MSEAVFGIPFEFLLIILVITIGISVIIIRKVVTANKLLKFALLEKQSRARLMGSNTALGDIHQHLGDFAILTEYDQLITLSTTSKQPSLDIIGIKEDRMDFIEFKKKGARVSPAENKVRRIVDAKEVYYKVMDVEIPTGIVVEERELKPLRKRNARVA